MLLRPSICLARLPPPACRTAWHAMPAWLWWQAAPQQCINALWSCRTANVTQHCSALVLLCPCRYLPREEHAFGALVMLMFEQGLRQLYSRSMLQLQVGGTLLLPLLLLLLLSHCQPVQLTACHTVAKHAA